MPTKQLPAIGDSNWGVTLNNYLNQSLDTQGGIKSHTNIAARPTLVADDKGFTSINLETDRKSVV